MESGCRGQSFNAIVQFNRLMIESSPGNWVSFYGQGLTDNKFPSLFAGMTWAFYTPDTSGTALRIDGKPHPWLDDKGTPETSDDETMPGHDTLVGGSADEAIFGDSGDDVLSANGGDDGLDGWIGRDRITAGSGDDKIYIGDFDTVDGGSGWDRIEYRDLGFKGNNTVSGGSGFDTFRFGVSTDITANVGTGKFIGDGIVNTVSGIESFIFDTRSGHDLLFNGAVTSNLSVQYRGSGDGTFGDITTGSGHDIVIIGDSVLGYIKTGAGNDYIRIEDYSYALVEAGDGHDYIIGHGTSLNTGLGVNAHGGNGIDFIEGSGDTDTLYGDAGQDSLFGLNDNDILYGGADSDFLQGDSGNDTLDGGTGDDLMLGGAGADRFILKGTGLGNDTIGDFSYSSGDRLVLTGGTSYQTVDLGADVVLSFGTSSVMLVGIETFIPAMVMFG